MRWIPLEANPEVMNKYINQLGCSTDEWHFVDIYGLDTELLAMVPRPVAAVLLLYPLTTQVDATPIGDVTQDLKDVTFLRQTVGNACGTMAILHALVNNKNDLKFKEGSTIERYCKLMRELTPQEFSDVVQSDPVISQIHEECSLGGSTEAPDASVKTNLHFVSFVHIDGKLYELDGRRDGPVHHGPTQPSTFLEDCANVVKKFTARDPNEINFNLIALAKVQ